MSKLLRTQFFPSRDGQGLWYYLKDRITEFPKVVQSMYQRATRGWADCDVWSIDIWFTSIVPDMLKRLRDNGIGYPAILGHLGDTLGPKEWECILTQMADDLEALKRHEERWFGEFGLYETENCDLEHSRQCYRDEMEATRIVQRGLFEFYVWFFSLWD